MAGVVVCCYKKWLNYWYEFGTIDTMILFRVTLHVYRILMFMNVIVKSDHCSEVSTFSFGTMKKVITY